MCMLVGVFLVCSGVVQLMMPLDREKQDMYQLRMIAFDTAARPNRSVHTSLCLSLSVSKVRELSFLDHIIFISYIYSL